MTAPTLDGSVAAQATGTNTCSVTVTTTQANDIVCLLSYCENYPSTNGPAITGISGGGLTWALRKRSHGSSRGSMELWWALATSPLSAATITASFAANFDSQSLIVFGVSGCDTSAPWDSDASLPASASNTGGGNIAPTYTISTANSDDFLVIAAGCGWLTDPPGSIPSGFTMLAHHSNGSGGFWGTVAVAYKQVTSLQSAASVIWGTINDQGLGATESLIDALSGGAGGPPPAAASGFFRGVI